MDFAIILKLGSGSIASVLTGHTTSIFWKLGNFFLEIFLRVCPYILTNMEGLFMRELYHSTHHIGIAQPMFSLTCNVI